MKPCLIRQQLLEHSITNKYHQNTTFFRRHGRCGFRFCASYMPNLHRAGGVLPNELARATDYKAWYNITTTTQGENMKKGDQIKLIGRYPFCGREGIVEYSWPKIWRHTTAEEVQAWRDGPYSKGMNSAGETKLPPRIAQVEYEGGTLHRPDRKIKPWEEVKTSDDIFTVVRARCAPILGYHKYTKMALVRNNRTGEEGYVKRSDCTPNLPKSSCKTR